MGVTRKEELKLLKKIGTQSIHLSSTNAAVPTECASVSCGGGGVTDASSK